MSFELDKGILIVTQVDQLGSTYPNQSDLLVMVRVNFPCKIVAPYLADWSWTPRARNAQAAAVVCKWTLPVSFGRNVLPLETGSLYSQGPEFYANSNKVILKFQ